MTEEQKQQIDYVGIINDRGKKHPIIGAVVDYVSEWSYQ